MYEEEIDLRVYIDVLLRRRRLIITLALGMAVVAMIVSFLLPPTYEAQAALSVAPRRSNITLTEDFVLSEEEISQLSANQRAEALTEIARSLKVAQAVLDTYPNLDGEDATANSMVNRIEVSTKNDLLLITASADGPQKAADLATAWAEATKDQINEVYTFDTEIVGEIEAEMSDAWTEYLAAQEALETFLSESNLSALESRIKVVERLLERYEQTLAENQAAGYTQPLVAQNDRLATLYAQINQIDQHLTHARALKQQMIEDPSSLQAWGTSLAYIELNTQAFSSVAPSPQTDSTGERTTVVRLDAGAAPILQLNLDGTPPTLTLAEIEQLIAALETMKTDVEEQATALHQQLGQLETATASPAEESVLQQQVEALTEELSSLQSRLEAQEAREEQLTEVRDVSWTTYKSLSNKQREIRVQESVAASEARLAFEAMPPATPSAPSKKLNTAVAGALGLMLGIFGAFMVEYLVPEPDPEAQRGLVSRWLLSEAPGLPNFDPEQHKAEIVRPSAEAPERTETS